MTFATEKTLQTSSKATLVRFKPARDISDDMSALSGTGTATFAFDNVQAITVDGTAYTKVSGTPSAGEFSFNEDTKLITIEFSAASTAVIVSYYIFVTSGDAINWHEDPEDTATSLRFWEARVRGQPIIASQIEDIYEGVMAVSGSTISLINTDKLYNKYLGDGDSFYKRNVDIWVALNGPENIQKLFQGKVTEISLDERIVTLKVKDNLQGLSEPAHFTNETFRTHYNFDDYANLDPAAQGEPVRFAFGTVTQHNYRSTGTLLTGSYYDLELIPQSMLKAVNTSYSENISTSTNRDWGCCNAIKQISTNDTIATVDNTAGGYTKITLTSKTAELWIGDQFRATGSGTYHGEVLNIDHATPEIYVTKTAGLTVGDTLTVLWPSAVVVYEASTDTSFYLRPFRDFIQSLAAVVGSDFEYLTINLVNNFEANHAGLTTLDPSQHEVYYMTHPGLSQTGSNDHSKIMQTICENAGLTINSASFTQAQTDRDVQANFTIPTRDQSDYGTYLEYAGKLCQSVFGYLRINNNFEVEYKIFSAPTGGTTFTDDDILANTFRIEIEYEDVTAQIVANNRHYYSTEATRDSAATPTKTKGFTRPRHLHDNLNVFNLDHFAEEINDVADDLGALKAQRKAIYSFQTKTAHLDALIGDVAKLEKSGLLGTKTSTDVIIIGLEKSVDGVIVRCMDLYNLAGTTPIVH